MTTTKATTEAIAAMVEEITEQYGVEVEITGGGKGWTATATDEQGTEHTAKAESKMIALEALSNRLDEREEAEEAEDMAEFDEESCSAECQSANPNTPCSCKCGGANHPKASSGEVVVVGPKPCKCGCGQITNRAFFPGHDARYHFAQRAVAAGMDVEVYRANLKAVRNAVAAAKRRERRAAAKAEAVTA